MSPQASARPSNPLSLMADTLNRTLVSTSWSSVVAKREEPMDTKIRDYIENSDGKIRDYNDENRVPPNGLAVDVATKTNQHIPPNYPGHGYFSSRNLESTSSSISRNLEGGSPMIQQQYHQASGFITPSPSSGSASESPPMPSRNLESGSSLVSRNLESASRNVGETSISPVMPPPPPTYPGYFGYYQQHQQQHQAGYHQQMAAYQYPYQKPLGENFMNYCHAAYGLYQAPTTDTLNSYRAQLLQQQLYEQQQQQQQLQQDLQHQPEVKEEAKDCDTGKAKGAGGKRKGKNCKCDKCLHPEKYPASSQPAQVSIYLSQENFLFA